MEAVAPALFQPALLRAFLRNGFETQQDHREATLLEVHLLEERRHMEVALHIDPEIRTASGDVARDVRLILIAVKERLLRDRASDGADDGWEGKAAVAPLHPAVARHDDGDQLGVVLDVGPSRRLLTDREVARKRKNVLQIRLAKGCHGPSQQVRRHQHEGREPIGLDLPPLPLVAFLGGEAYQAGFLARESAGLIRNGCHEEVAEFARDGEAATQFRLWPRVPS